MKSVAVMITTVFLASCATQGYMGDEPQIRPAKPAADVKIEMEGADTICVTENNVRTCVPRVGEEVGEEVGEDKT